jgi:hypothetical protein
MEERTVAGDIGEGWENFQTHFWGIELEFIAWGWHIEQKSSHEPYKTS